MPISTDFNYQTGKYEGRLCRFCNKQVLGRLDKVFCCDKCRIRYRNEINRFKRNFLFKFDSEAHNYFLLARELRSRDIMLTRTIGLTELSVHGFDFRFPIPKFTGSKGNLWFCLGNLMFKVIPEKNELHVKHFAGLKGEDLEETGEISLEKAFPELGLRTLYKGPI